MRRDAESFAFAICNTLMRESRSCTRAVVRETQLGFLMGGASSSRPADVPCVAQPLYLFFNSEKWANQKIRVSHAYLRVSPFYAVSCTDAAGPGRIHAT